MKRAFFLFIPAFLMVLFLTTPAQAQTDPGWWQWALPTMTPRPDLREDRRDDRRTRDRDRRWENDRRSTQQGKAKNGPAFCRSGEGHPVFGMAWCSEKGFGRSRYDQPHWQRERRYEDIVFRRTDRRTRLDERTLGDILGSVVFGQFRQERARLGTGPLEGRWLPTGRGGLVLQLRAGGYPLAELTDLNGDGRVDVALFNRFR